MDRQRFVTFNQAEATIGQAGTWRVHYHITASTLRRLIRLMMRARRRGELRGLWYFRYLRAR